MDFMWKEELATGHPEIDAQHRKILTEMTLFHNALKNHEGRGKGQETLAFLRGYLLTHFQAEELLMQDCSFPGVKTHQAEHAQFSRRFAKLSDTFQTEGASAGFLLGLHRLCVDLAFSHIQSFDQEMAQFVKRAALPVNKSDHKPEGHFLKKLLVVEDSGILQKMYDLILGRYRRAGVEVFKANDGNEALALLQAHPDMTLILTDRNMPGMDGLEFIRRCKDNAAWAKIPILVVSTLHSEESIQEALRLGARGYITKPFTPDDLYSLIERLFRRTPGAVQEIRTA